MDDLIANITEMLNSEEGMKNLKEMADALGLDLGTDGGEGKTADSPQQHNPSASDGLGGLGDIDMNMILGLRRPPQGSQAPPLRKTGRPGGSCNQDHEAH